MERKKVALVLSGGSALGFAHIGVIKILEKYNVPIDIIVGTSMGGLVGASYASGLSVKEMTDFACKFKKIHFIDVNFNASGIFSGKGVMKNINKFLPDKKIEELNISFGCVACDLLTEKEVVFTTGSVRDAVRSTLSIPGFFVPYSIEDKLLVDGGVVNNLPDDLAVKMGADVIIAVDVLSKCKLKEAPKNAFDSLIASINVLTKEVQNYKSIHSDVLLQPDISSLTQMSFGKKNTLKAISIGEKECENHIKEILQLIK